MKKSMCLLLLLTFLVNLSGFSLRPNKSRKYGLGMDLVQPFYMLDSRKNGLNCAFAGMYKPYNFLSLNASVFYNQINYDKKSAYRNLSDYSSIGTCFKLGPELSLKVGRRKKIVRRLGWGYNYGLLNFREKAHIVIHDPVWGDYDVDFKTPQKRFGVWEYYFNYQLEVKTWMLKFQVFGLFNSSSRNINDNTRMFSDYKSIFVPGYGYNRGGINLFVYYKFH